MALDIDRLSEEVVRGTQLLIDRAVKQIAADNAALRREVEGLLARLADVEARAPVPGPRGEPGAQGEQGPPGKDGADGKDGRDGIDGVDGAPGRDGVDGAPGRDGADGAPGRDGLDGAAGRDGIDGKDVDPAEVQAMVAKAVSEIEIPAPRDGIDGKDGRDGIDGKDGRDGIDGKDGLLPLIRAWDDRVHYAGECVTRNGATWQAQRDTGREPPHEDWLCIAAAGRDGRSFTFRGTYEPSETYAALDVVALDGGSFVALSDAPEDAPGSGPNWKLLVQRGKPGQKGEKGDRGDIGPKGRDGLPGPALIAADVSDEGVLTLTCDDGRTVTADFYDVLRRLQ
jgi:hypothetical protein